MKIKNIVIDLLNNPEELSSLLEIDQEAKVVRQFRRQGTRDEAVWTADIPDEVGRHPQIFAPGHGPDFESSEDSVPAIQSNDGHATPASAKSATPCSNGTGIPW